MVWMYRYHIHSNRLSLLIVVTPRLSPVRNLHEWPMSGPSLSLLGAVHTSLWPPFTVFVGSSAAPSRCPSGYWRIPFFCGIPMESIKPCESKLSVSSAQGKCFIHNVIHNLGGLFCILPLSLCLHSPHLHILIWAVTLYTPVYIGPRWLWHQAVR